VARSVELRSVLETEALRLACARRTQEDLDRLQALLADSAAVVKRGDSLADLDAEFHKAIVAATKNDVGKPAPARPKHAATRGGTAR
jgi:GntR family transcriptional regulator, transcriptional repressor for pyruvate dehydrogenase complex